MSERRILDRPEPGYWLIRLVKGGPLVPACIRRICTTAEPGNASNNMAGTRSPFFAAFVQEQAVDIDRVWHSRGQPISESEYLYRCADAAWAKEYSPEEPAANPRTAIDPMQASLPF